MKGKIVKVVVYKVKFELSVPHSKRLLSGEGSHILLYMTGHGVVSP